MAKLVSVLVGVLSLHLAAVISLGSAADRKLAGGTRFSEPVSFARCAAICAGSAECHGFNYNPYQRLCELFLAPIPCNQHLVHAPDSIYYLTRPCLGGVGRQGILDNALCLVRGSPTASGLRLGTTSLVACFDSCQDDSGCQAATWNLYNSSCTGFTTSGTGLGLQATDCCYTVVKDCSVISSSDSGVVTDDPITTTITTSTTTTTPSTTTNPPVALPNVDPAPDVAGPRRCYSGSVTLSLLDTSAFSITNPTNLTEFTAIDCGSGVCATNIDIDFITGDYTAARSCDTSGALYADAVCRSPPDIIPSSFNCLCLGDLCNALFILPAAYYSFDNTLDDTSGSLRDAFIVQGSDTADYVTDSVRTSSLMLDGSTCVKANFQGIYQGHEVNGGITLAFWVRRLAYSGDQTVLTNGPPGGANIEVFSEAIDFADYTLGANFKIQDQIFMVNGTLDLYLWNFVAFVLTRDGSTVTLEMLAAPLTDPTLTLTSLATTGPETDPDPSPINPSPYGLFFGCQPTTFDSLNAATAYSEFLFGGLDEFYIYDTALTQEQVQAVADLQKTV